MRTYHTRTRGSTGQGSCADEGLHRAHTEQLEQEENIHKASLDKNEKTW